MSLTPLVVLFLVYWATSLASNLNIGHRHILPTYPVLFILLGSLGRFLSRRSLVAGAVVLALGVAHVVESWRIRPHYLAYFNPLAGGPENGWRHLVDSSLDWGQDLPGLKRWLDEHAGSDRVYLAYFGTGDPAYEGIDATLLPTLPVVGARRPWHRLEPGLYAVSATMLQHVYSPVRGDWTVEFEREYQQLRPLEPAFLAFDRDPSRVAELQPALPAERWKALGRRYETLRFARLCHYLRARQPEAVIHHTILVHRLTAEELAAVLEGPASRWQDAIEAARARGRR